MTASVRVLIVVALLAAPAVAEPLADAELRLGYGVAMSGGGGMTAARTTPLTITAQAAVLVSDEPKLSAFGGLVVETLDKSSVGAVAGMRLAGFDRALRLSGGATTIIAPYTMWGAMASGGACKRNRKGLGACGDLQMTAYFAGTDLAEGRTVTHVQAVLSLVFDAY
jgi:hypothetical protein